MKKVLIAMAMLLVSGIAMSQDVTTFMGIPIDGTKDEMIKKLEEKGFTKDAEFLRGKFYGEDVLLSIGEDNDLVSTIYIIFNDSSMDEAKTLYNSLVADFSKNKKYIPDGGDGIIIDKTELRHILVSEDRTVVSYFLQKGHDGDKKKDIENKTVTVALSHSSGLNYSVGIAYCNEYNMPDHSTDL